MEIKTNKEKNTVTIVNDDGTREITIKNINGWSRHSVARMAMVDAKTNEVLASLSGGGSYGWIINTRDLRRRSLLLKVARKAKSDGLYWPWTNVQC